LESLATFLLNALRRLFLYIVVGLAELFSQNVSEAKYLAATSYTVDLRSKEPNNFDLRRPSVKVFNYWRFSIILRIRSYLLGHLSARSYARLLQTYDLSEYQQQPIAEVKWGRKCEKFKFKFVRILMADLIYVKYMLNTYFL